MRASCRRPMSSAARGSATPSRASAVATEAGDRIRRVTSTDKRGQCRRQRDTVLERRLQLLGRIDLGRCTHATQLTQKSENAVGDDALHSAIHSARQRRTAGFMATNATPAAFLTSRKRSASLAKSDAPSFSSWATLARLSLGEPAVDAVVARYRGVKP